MLICWGGTKTTGSNPGRGLRTVSFPPFMAKVFLFIFPNSSQTSPPPGSQGQAVLVGQAGPKVLSPGTPMLPLSQGALMEQCYILFDQVQAFLKSCYLL